MTTLPGSLQTLPPDGTVLEELISAMQSEYGVPATPQEYRLIIKTPGTEDSTDPSIEVKAASPAAPPAESKAEDGSGAQARGNRRRRRSRRRDPGSPNGAAIASEAGDVAAADAGFLDEDADGG